MENHNQDKALRELQGQGGRTEVYPGMTVEEIKAVFFDRKALREPPYRIYQLNSGGHRYYYAFDEKGEPHFYPSVTTILHQTMPMAPGLINWILENGKEGADEKRDIAAAYGTFMHIQFEKLVINRRYDFDAVPAALLQYMKQENLPDSFYAANLTKVRKDVLAFAQFIKDYDVRPLAVEIGLVHPMHHYAGCIDLPCVMTDPKTGEEFPAIVDFKSGRKGFYEEHELQLFMYREAWNYNFPGIPIERVFNFSPKDWRKAPGYNLKEQTASRNAGKMQHILAIAAIEDEKRDNIFTVVHGVLDLDGGDLSDNLLQLSLAELVRGKAEKKADTGCEAPGPIDYTPETLTARK